MGFTLTIKNKNMKKLTLFFAIVLLSITAKSQTVILKQEIDTAFINSIYKCNTINNVNGQNKVAKGAKAKKEFVNDLILLYLKQLTRDCIGGEEADKARKAADVEIEKKVINKVD